MRSDEIVARIREIKADRTAAVVERDAALIDRDTIKGKLDEVRNLVAIDGESLTLTKLPAFLKSLRALIEDSLA